MLRWTDSSSFDPSPDSLGFGARYSQCFWFQDFLHELALSYPAGAGFGGPLHYFAIQGAATIGEKRVRIRSRVLSWLVSVLPLPFLIHRPFRVKFILPLYHWLNHVITGHPLSWFVDGGLWILGVMQLLVLMASFQVPSRLRRKEELPKVSTLNQKLMWTNGSFIVLTIIAFGILTLTLHRSLMNRKPAAIGIASFVLIFWLLRIGVDRFYYRPSDWPKGEQFVMGHALLSSLFTVLAFGYGSCVIWAIW